MSPIPSSYQMGTVPKLDNVIKIIYTGVKALGTMVRERIIETRKRKGKREAGITGANLAEPPALLRAGQNPELRTHIQ